jgi:septum site-determining protein MinD
VEKGLSGQIGRFIQLLNTKYCLLLLVKGHLMAKIYTIASIKGGVGKTTVAGNIGVALGMLRRKTLLVDADLAMGGLTDILGINETKSTLHELLAGKGNIDEAVHKLPGGTDILPAGKGLQGYLKANPKKLGPILRQLAGGYSYVIIDTPPGLSKYNLEPLKIADEVLLVVTPDISAVQAGAKLESVAKVFGAKIGGVVVNRIKKPSILDRLFRRKPKVAALIKRRLKSRVIGAVPEDSEVVKSANARKPVVVYKPKSAAAKALKRLAQRLPT